MGTDRLNSAPAAPSKETWAWNWRGSAFGAACAATARRAVKAVMVKNCILNVVLRIVIERERKLKLDNLLDLKSD